jgi:hypothetical protein
VIRSTATLRLIGLIAGTRLVGLAILLVGFVLLILLTGLLVACACLLTRRLLLLLVFTLLIVVLIDVVTHVSKSSVLALHG